jgi:hypothetical protein
MSILFLDDFNTPGPDVNRAIWTTPTGDAAFFRADCDPKPRFDD